MNSDLETILDNTPVLLTRCTRDLRYLYVSKAYATMLGRPSDEVSGRPMIDILGPEWFETIRPHIETVLQGQRVEFEATFHFAGVGPRHIHVTYVPERDEHSQVVGWIASMTDITDYKKATQQLTHLVRVATLDGLSGAIAHELSQPLAAILANAQAAQKRLPMEDRADLKEVAEILEEIVEADIRAEQVLRNLHTLLRKGEHQEAPINLNNLLASTLQLLHSELVNKRIKVDAELKSELPQVLGDSVELQQVLINLMMNAIAAMAPIPPPERMLTIASGETKEGNVELSIRDRGPGVSPDELERIFDPFFTTKQEGLGLGLSICANIIKSHRGLLTLQNAPGGGILATVSIPKKLNQAGF